MADAYFPLIMSACADPVLEKIKYTNFLRLLRERRVQRDTLSARPIHATIDLTTTCQLKCPYCSTGNGTLQRTRSILRPENTRWFASDLYETMFLVAFFSTGEPLLNKWMPQIVREAADYGVFSTMSTNLSLELSDHRIEEILTSGLGIILASIDGTNPESYCKYRVGGNFDMAMGNLRRLVARKRELGLEYPLIEWRFLVFEHNQDELEIADQMAADIGVDLLEFFPGYTPKIPAADGVRPATKFRSATFRSPRLAQLSERRERTLQAFLRDDRGKASRDPMDYMKDPVRKCDWLTMGTMIFPTGAVSPCCASNDEPDDFGNIRTAGSFDAVWNNQRYQAARKFFKGERSSEHLICERCPIPSAQHYQFRRILQMVLRMAPDWVLRILCRDPDGFFFPIDRGLLPDELGAIFSNAIFPGEIESSAGTADDCLDELIAGR